MTVKEFIKNKDFFMITRDSKILAIKNPGDSIGFRKDCKDTSFLNDEVKNVDIIKGLYADLTGIRI